VWSFEDSFGLSFDRWFEASFDWSFEFIIGNQLGAFKDLQVGGLVEGSIEVFLDLLAELLRPESGAVPPYHTSVHWAVRNRHFLGHLARNSPKNRLYV
jgi:hypothetical protein